MKKNSINRFTVIIVTALFMLTTTAFAGKHVEPVKYSVKQTAKGDAYMAHVTINVSGMADTPYRNFSAQPELVYAQINNSLERQTGLFHVHITFVNNDGEIVSEDDYYIDNRDHLDAIKYD